MALSPRFSASNSLLDNLLLTKLDELAWCLKSAKRNLVANRTEAISNFDDSGSGFMRTVHSMGGLREALSNLAGSIYVGRRNAGLLLAIPATVRAKVRHGFPGR